MGRRVRVSGRTLKRIRDVGTVLPKIDRAEVAEALGAESTGVEVGRRGSPVSVRGVQEAITRRLQSTGGRPGLRGVSRRPKVPMTAGDWASLKKIADQLEAKGTRTSPGQVASVLLHLSLEAVERPEEHGAWGLRQVHAQLTRELADLENTQDHLRRIKRPEDRMVALRQQRRLFPTLVDGVCAELERADAAARGEVILRLLSEEAARVEALVLFVRDRIACAVDSPVQAREKALTDGR